MSSHDRLLAWFTQNGGWLNPDVQLVYTRAQGHHLRALRPTSPAIVTCPLKLTLSTLNLDPDQKEVLPITSPLQRCRGRIPDHILTYLLLIEQRNKGEHSPWHPYIACLPGVQDMTTPLWFDEEDVAFLAGTSLAPALTERKADYHKQWELAVSVLRADSVDWADDVDFESLLWAATIFTSRAFISTHILPDIETTPILFPVLDILNHSVTARVEWDFQPHQSFTLRCLDSANLTADEELFNNYAPKQNDELLLGYGFCLDNNPIEQFALKLAFQPELMQYATQMGLMQPDTVPFGMDPSFLQTDPNREQHFLRVKGHPFGRYDNNIPFFRGIPPYIVHFFFIQTILSLDLDMAEITPAHPGERITTHILIHLHRALTQRSTTLPPSTPLVPNNTKQRFALSYRTTQAAILHAILSELSTQLSTLLLAPSHPLPTPTTLISLPTALALLRTEYPSAHSTFLSGMEKHSLSPTNPRDATLLFALLLPSYAALVLTNTHNAAGLASPLLARLAATHPLPRIEDGIEDAETYAFVDANWDDFVRVDGQTAGVGEALDELGETFVESGDEAFVRGRTEDLGVRLVMWGLSVGADVVEVGGEVCVVVVGSGVST